MAALGAGLGLFFVGLDPVSATAPNPRLGNVLSPGLRRHLGADHHGAAGARQARRVVGARLGLLGQRVRARWRACPSPCRSPTSAPMDWALVGFLGVFQIALAYLFLIRGLENVRRLRGLAAAAPGAGAQPGLGLDGPRRAAGQLVARGRGRDPPRHRGQELGGRAAPHPTLSRPLPAPLPGRGKKKPEDSLMFSLLSRPFLSGRGEKSLCSPSSPGGGRGRERRAGVVRAYFAARTSPRSSLRSSHTGGSLARACSSWSSWP